ncbi:aminotransferase class I/II-fold pyridoxal phosphate-dependent enzyme [Streptomyces sp. NPDC051644]|uniref:aminotransferase class I/II-fold pyridoxal phosphate-dependent enzyme n=1 Tax=Streptomyces sp. NPDC051644 TaxID=3365666 RepID=UPI0037A39808
MHKPTGLAPTTPKNPTTSPAEGDTTLRPPAPSPAQETAHRQGGDLRAYSAGQISLDLSVCHNRYGPPRHVLNSIQELLAQRPEDLAPPPYGCEEPYLEAFAEHLGGVSPDDLLPGRGVTEFLTVLARVLSSSVRGGSLLSRLSRLAGRGRSGDVLWRLARGGVGVIAPDYTETMNLFHYADFHSPDVLQQDSAEQRLHRLRQAMARHTGGAVILSNPCNPTGIFLTREDLLHAAAEHRSTLLVVDEEYLGLRGGPELGLAGTDLDNVVVLQSVGKSYGMVGVRAGVLWTCNDQFRQRIASQLIRWPLSLLDAQVATAALHDKVWLAVTRAAIHDDAARLQNALTSVFGARVVKSQLHYRFVHLHDPLPVVEHLTNCGIAVRAFTKGGPRVSGMRVAAPKGPQELALLTDALVTLPSAWADAA